MSAEVFVVVSIRIEKRRPNLFLFWFETTTKTFAEIWCLVFGF
jgi:hypothetical protein